MRIHFIAIGGSAMHNLAIALKRTGNKVSGSDDAIFEPSKSRLAQAGLLPSKTAWDIRTIRPDLDAVIVGMHARPDNPELLRAQQMNLPIYSYPAFVASQIPHKKRLVVGGSHGKTTITAMVLHAMKVLGISTDYLVGALLEGFDCMVQLSDAPVIVIEGDEYLSSPIDPRPKFHWYAPHIGIISGIAWDHMNVFPTFDTYVNQFKHYVDRFEKGGVLIYCAEDSAVQSLLPRLRSDIHKKPYSTPEHTIREGTTYLITPKGEVPLRVFGKHNLQNMMAARLMLREIGVGDSDFYAAMTTFTGASKRLERIAKGKHSSVYKDFAHSPSKLKATVSAVKQQYPSRKLIACMELHTFSSLNPAFLPLYKGSMDEADEAWVYFDPDVVAHKQLQPLTPQMIKTAFGAPSLNVFSSRTEMTQLLEQYHSKECNLLIMSSGNFQGWDIDDFAQKFVHDERG